MIVSINQPAYLPWLGYFHRIAVSELHIVLDSVQFEKNSYTNRNKARTKEGWTWMSVPVRTKGMFGSLPISGLEIVNETDWARKHWDTIHLNYAKAPHFAEHAGFFESIYGRRWERLADLMQETNHYLLDAFGIHTPLRYSSRMSAKGHKDELVLDLCREVGATTYISGPLGRDYLREEIFEEAGIRVVYDDYNHPTYPQAHVGFEPHMCALDLLFNRGPESLGVLLQSKELVAP